MVRKAAEIIARALIDVRLRESPIGSNDGADLRDALRRTPFKPGDPWCYYWVLSVMLDVFNDEAGLPPSVMFTGSCQEASGRAAANRMLSQSPATGSIFLLQNLQGHFHHAGFVTAVDEWHNQVETIEGNTNQGGSVEGYGVFRRTRPIGPAYRYIIWK